MRERFQSRQLCVFMECVAIVLFFLYPMRHVTWGLDLWDTGYNYTNYMYTGAEHMGSMWFFATYLANWIGHFFTLLPFGKTLIGLNVYTGLFPGILATLGYFFCTRKLNMPKWLVFIGEIAALSLCWCPTALLYNYVTYTLLLLTVVLLYIGLVEERRLCLFLAGVCLGTNLFVRFSNLPEAGLILAVWLYVFWGDKGDKGKLLRAGRYTFSCMGGYLSAVVLWLGFLSIRYGFVDYVSGIKRLFGMTKDATDYTAKSMIAGIIIPYSDMLYWVLRMLVFVVLGTVVYVLMALLGRIVQKQCTAIAIQKTVRVTTWGAVGLVIIGMFVWLFGRGFTSNLYTTYDPMYRPTVLIMMITMVVGAIQMVRPKCEKQEKLLSVLVILILLLTSIGSNNSIYPSINNLFIAAPYLLWEIQKFVRMNSVWKRCVSALALKFALLGVALLFLVQGVLFGVYFAFAEGTGMKDTSTQIGQNSVLSWVKMSPQRAEWMGDLGNLARKESWQNRELITFGNAPALSFYLQKPPAFHSWIDLKSYSTESLQNDLERLEEDIQSGKKNLPLIIIRKSEDESLKDKEELLQSFISNQEYLRIVVNDDFVAYE